MRADSVPVVAVLCALVCAPQVVSAEWHVQIDVPSFATLADLSALSTAETKAFANSVAVAVTSASPGLGTVNAEDVSLTIDPELPSDLRILITAQDAASAAIAADELLDAVVAGTLSFAVTETISLPSNAVGFGSIIASFAPEPSVSPEQGSGNAADTGEGKLGATCPSECLGVAPAKGKGKSGSMILDDIDCSVCGDVERDATGKTGKKNKKTHDNKAGKMGKNSGSKKGKKGSAGTARHSARAASEQTLLADTFGSSRKAQYGGAAGVVALLVVFVALGLAHVRRAAARDIEAFEQAKRPALGPSWLYSESSPLFMEVETEYSLNTADGEDNLDGIAGSFEAADSYSMPTLHTDEAKGSRVRGFMLTAVELLSSTTAWVAPASWATGDDSSKDTKLDRAPSPAMSEYARPINDSQLPRDASLINEPQGMFTLFDATSRSTGMLWHSGDKNAGGRLHSVQPLESEYAEVYDHLFDGVGDAYEPQCADAEQLRLEMEGHGYIIDATIDDVDGASEECVNEYAMPMLT